MHERSAGPTPRKARKGGFAYVLGGLVAASLAVSATLLCVALVAFSAQVLLTVLGAVGTAL